MIALAGAIFFSTKAIFVKLAFNATRVDAITLLSLRMLFSLPFYAGIAFFSAKKDGVIAVTKRQWLYIALMGILGYYVSSLFDFIGLQYVSAGLERLILFLYPTFAVLINTYFFKSKLNKVQIIALLLTYIGIGLAYFGELRLDTSNPNFFYGSFMIFLCAITYSIYLVGTGRLVQKVGATRYTAYAMLFATVGVFAHFLSTTSVTAFHFTPTLIGYGITLAIVATVVPSFLISNAMKRIGSNNVSIITSIGPVSTILQAHFVLHEKMFPEQIIGTIIVVAGVVLIGWRRE
ncbi:MAG: DMT family transporter [Deinococcales bacterium]|nr:DMT family transporter [Chitinophagaceae bacterium]